MALLPHILGHSASCSFQEYDGHAPQMISSFLESAFLMTCASALLGGFVASVKQAQQRLYKDFSVYSNSLLVPAVDSHVFVVQTHGVWSVQRIVAAQFWVLLYVVDCLDLGLEDQVCMPIDAKATSEEVEHAALDHLAWMEFLFPCFSVHPQTSVCKEYYHWFPSPQKQECQVAVSTRLISTLVNFSSTMIMDKK
jgi:hypothetical protein